jgi:tetratricopeptide (TPR) repeat protein
VIWPRTLAAAWWKDNPVPSAARTKPRAGLPALALCLALPTLSQIDKPPEFEDPAAFRAGGAAAPEGSSHVSARGENVSLNLLRHLAGFEKAAATEPERRAFLEGYGLLRQRMAAAAISSFQQAASRHPDSEPILCGLAVALYIAGSFDESAALLVRRAERNPTDLRLVPLLGETGGASRTHRTAIEQRLRDFVRAAPSSAAARYYLATLLASGPSPASDEAVALWTEAAKLDAGDARPCLELARVEAARDRTDAAIAWLNCAVQRDPSSAEAHYRLARLYFQTNQRGLADKHLRQFRALQGNRVEPRVEKR